LGPDLDAKATIPTTWFLCEITVVNTDALDNSGTETIRDIEKDVEKGN